MQTIISKAMAIEKDDKIDLKGIYEEVETYLNEVAPESEHERLITMAYETANNENKVKCRSVVLTLNVLSFIVPIVCFLSPYMDASSSSNVREQALGIQLLVYLVMMLVAVAYIVFKYKFWQGIVCFCLRCLPSFQERMKAIIKAEIS